MGYRSMASLREKVEAELEQMDHPFSPPQASGTPTQMPPQSFRSRKSRYSPAESRGIFLPVCYNGTHVKIRTSA